MQIIQKQSAMVRPWTLIVVDIERFALSIHDIHVILGSTSLKEV
jgi:hypothetical protein